MSFEQAPCRRIAACDPQLKEFYGIIRFSSYAVSAKSYLDVELRSEHGKEIPFIASNELESGAEQSPISPRHSIQQNSQTATQTNFGASIPFNAFGSTVVGLGIRIGQTVQAKNSVFSNALTSPIRRSLQLIWHRGAVIQVI